MAEYHKPESKTVNELKDIAQKLRIHSIKATNASNSGHPTSCASMAELMSCLFFNEMRYKVSEPKDPASDRFVLSKGHAAPILYAAWAEAGLFPTSDLLNLRKIDSDLEGHPTPRLNFIDVGTGSLGQGVSIAVGMAYCGKYIDKADYRCYCLVGDGESAEGSIWEGLNFGSYYKLDNFVVIFDINRLGQSQPSMLQHDMETYRKRLEAFGYNTLVIDGHDCEEICKAYFNARQTKGRPTAILARTLKGKNFPNIEDLENWHGKPIGKDSDKVIQFLNGLIKNNGKHQLVVPKPTTQLPPVDLTNLRMISRPNYKIGEMVATRLAYGNGLQKLAQANSRVIALDGDTKNSTFSDKVLKAVPEQYIECFIAEQNLVGVGIGIGCRDRTVAFVSTFACFFTRAFDQLRMGAISQSNVNCCGSHAGVSIGEDGPSQMALEDLALFRSIPGSTVFYPTDAVSCENAVEIAANTKGICFIRAGRPNTAVIYSNDHVFQIGKANVIRKSDKDVALIIGAGVTIYEALKAADNLATKGIHIRVLDPFTIKPIDSAAIIENAKACGGKIITVEDHYPEGGLGEAVMSAVALERNIVVKKLAVNSIPRSGPPDVLLQMFGIDSGAIIKAVESMK